MLPPMPPVPPENVWITLTHASNQSSMCVSLATPQSPFQTCLVGVPIHNSTEINALVNGTHANGKRLASTFEMLEPQEVDILGSLRASTCVYFNTSRAWFSGPSNDVAYPAMVLKCFALV